MGEAVNADARDALQSMSRSVAFDTERVDAT